MTTLAKCILTLLFLVLPMTALAAGADPQPPDPAQLLEVVNGTLSPTANCDTAQSPQAKIAQLFLETGVKSDIVKPAKGPFLKHPYLVPSGPYYQLFDWDTYFMGIALSYDGKGFVPALKGSVEDFLDNVRTTGTGKGYVARQIAPTGPQEVPEMCKPFIAQSAVLASEASGDYEWLRSDYEKLTDTLYYWEHHRKAKDGLFIWYDSLESGVDNNPAVSDNPPLRTEGVDLQVYMYREYLAVAKIAEKLGKRRRRRLPRESGSAREEGAGHHVVQG